MAANQLILTSSIIAMKTKPSTKAATKSAGNGKLMNGAEILVACLEREGVDVIFAYPGGCSM